VRDEKTREELLEEIGDLQDEVNSLLGDIRDLDAQLLEADHALAFYLKGSKGMCPRGAPNRQGGAHDA